MKSNAIDTIILIFSICFIFCSTSIFAEKSFVKSGEVPAGLDAASWEKIREQIRSPRSEVRDPRSEGQESNTPIFRPLGTASLHPSNNPLIQNSKYEIQNLSAPLYNAEVKLTASDAQADDWFGYAVAVDGDVAVVGAYKEDTPIDRTGAAYIFERNAGGINAWGQVKRLSGHSGWDVFGAGVAVGGDVIVIGAWGQDTGGNNAGAGYIYERNAGGINNWGEVKTLKASDPVADDRFGLTFAVDGDVVVAGVYRKNDLTGAAYIYERNEGGINNWGEVKKLIASDAQIDDRFGYSVAVAGDVMFIGAYCEDEGGTNAGAVYVFERNTGGINAWGEVKKLTASNSEENAYFGISVAVAGDTAIVCAYCEDVGGITNAGAAYVFERNAGGTDTWGEINKLIASDAEEGDCFGNSVAMKGDVVIVGAPYEDTGGISAGAAYIFERNAGSANAWRQVRKIMASDPEADDNFGRVVSIAADITILGTYKKNNFTGAAYIIPVSSKTKDFIETEKITASDAEAWDSFAFSVAVDGDVVVVGTPFEDSIDDEAGAAYIFERNTGGVNAWAQVKKLTASDGAASDSFGFAVAVAGDVIVVGASDKNTGQYKSGAAYIFERNANGTNSWGEVKRLIASVIDEEGYFGCSVAADGDLILVGANGEDAVAPWAGAAYIFERNIAGTNNWALAQKLIPSDAQEYNTFGTSVAVDGDVAVVGADSENGGNFRPGAAYVFERDAGGINSWGEVKKLSASDSQTTNIFGGAVAVNGDVIVIGADGRYADDFRPGAAYVFERGIDGINAWGQVKKLSAQDAAGRDWFGYSVAVAGDMIIVGARYADVSNSSAGAAYTFERNAGNTNDWGFVEKLIASDATAWDCVGQAVAIMGDVIVIGAFNEGAKAYNAGAAYIFEEFINLPPLIAANALIFPSADAVLIAPFPPNITWYSEKIIDGLDGTNLTITKISVYLAVTTNEVYIVTNNIDNLLGEIPWFVPVELIGGDTNYVLKFEVVDSSSLTNSRIFWDNKFTIVPEPCAVGAGIIYWLLFICILRWKFKQQIVGYVK